MARQLAALGLALCAVALSVAYPLRGYINAQNEQVVAAATQQQLESEIADLQAHKAALADPAYIKAEAKRRLQYVSPGDTVYVVRAPALPAAAAAPSAPAAQAPEPWYASMWGTLTDGVSPSIGGR